MKSVYLDWNIYVYLMEGNYQDVAGALSDAKSAGVVIPFSATHVDEATNIRRKTDIELRLEFIGKISNEVYFENSVTEFGLKKRSPFEVYRTLNEPPKVDKIIRFFGNVITRPMFMAARAALGLDPQQLNNVGPSEVWGEIDRIILRSKHAKKLPREFGDSPIRGILQYVKRDSIERYGSIHECLGGVKQRAAGPDVNVSVLFSLLESFGYFPESKKVFQKASRFNDASHCFYALWSDVCVSRDTGFRMKSKAIASLVGSNTEFVHPDQAATHIAGLQELTNF